MSTFTTVGDIKFFYLAKSAQTLGPADVAVEGSDLLRDPGFETAVLISLFSDIRADDSDVLPDTFTFRNGYFGDVLEDFSFGSKLWLLGRSNINNNTLQLAKQYVLDSLDWMKDDGIADSITVVVVRGGKQQINFSVSIKRKDADNVYFKFYANWEYQTLGGLRT